ncbi:hypothetical protein [Streptomyces silvensis]|uniref:Uncharacterized protein n=1 Tax=Streptomyces silvensis TaxID=1765722 RepID=A0A0W7WRI6_9ACTN|nr:hypothetical protein [Streptomyces silvensis]KUF13218.1 hypothetical protein AT728_38230 [Streptomyces silvensis]
MPQEGIGATAEELIRELGNRRTRHTAEAQAGQDPQGSSYVRDNALLDLARRGELSREHLRRLVAVDAQCQRTELAAYALMTTRFPHRPAADLYAGLIGLVGAAQPSLADCAKALGMSEEDFRHGPRTYRTYAFDGLLSWVALQGSQADTGLALHSDLTVYLGGCAELVQAVRTADIPAPDEFLAHYGTASAPDLLALALETTDDGLRRGDDPTTALHTAWLLEKSLEDFWRAAAEPARG